MKCKYCAYDYTSVIYTRKLDMKNAIERRRECQRCGQRFTTEEKQRSVNDAIHNNKIGNT